MTFTDRPTDRSTECLVPFIRTATISTEWIRTKSELNLFCDQHIGIIYKNPYTYILNGNCVIKLPRLFLEVTVYISYFFQMIFFVSSKYNDFRKTYVCTDEVASSRRSASIFVHLAVGWVLLVFTSVHSHCFGFLSMISGIAWISQDVISR